METKEQILAQYEILNKPELHVDYDINTIKKVGKGAFGDIFKCLHKKTQIYHAFKVMKCKSEKKIKQCQQEGTNLKLFNHPNITKIYQQITQEVKNKTPTCIAEVLIIMEYANKGTLKDLIIQQKRIRNKQLGKIIAQMSNAVQELKYKNMIQGDIKRNNILIFEDEKTKELTYKLSDFGGSQIITVPKSVSLHFTKLYSAPETVCSVNIPISYSSDIFSLGITFLSLLGVRKSRLKSINRTAIRIADHIYTNQPITSVLLADINKYNDYIDNAFQQHKTKTVYCQLIKKMLEINFQKRISIEQIQQYLRDYQESKIRKLQVKMMASNISTISRDIGPTTSSLLKQRNNLNLQIQIPQMAKIQSIQQQILSPQFSTTIQSPQLSQIYDKSVSNQAFIQQYNGDDLIQLFRKYKTCQTSNNNIIISGKIPLQK